MRCDISVINQNLKEKYPDLELTAICDDRNIVFLKGECDSWETLIDVGHFTATIDNVRNVVSDMTVKNLQIPKINYNDLCISGRNSSSVHSADIVIVGGGIIGCAIARALSKYQLKTVVIERGNDVCVGASKANNGNIHPGHAVKKGTLKWRLNILGNAMYDKWAEELNFEFQRNGQLYVAWSEEHIGDAKKRYYKAVENNVPGAAWLDGDQTLEIEPNLIKFGKPFGSAWIPTKAHVEPYEVTIALAENASLNGVDFFFNQTVCDVLHDENGVYAVLTDKGMFNTKYVVNCAGVYADDISAMAGDRSFTIHGRKGTIAICDKSIQYLFKAQTAFVGDNYIQRMTYVKNKDSKGGGCCKTPEGNYLLGPSAKETWDKEDTSVDTDGIDYALSCSLHGNIRKQDVIRYFSGVRAADFKEDFIIEASDVTKGLINVAAIQSPGLTCAPAIAEMVENILKQTDLPMVLSNDYDPCRRKRKVFRKCSDSEKAALIAKDPSYGKIVCRCEGITEGEILDALDSPIPPTSVDAVKRRTRAGMGRCQGGFCQPRVLEVMAKYYGVELDKIDITSLGSSVLKPMSEHLKGDKHE